MKSTSFFTLYCSHLRLMCMLETSRIKNSRLLSKVFLYISEFLLYLKYKHRFKISWSINRWCQFGFECCGTKAKEMDSRYDLAQFSSALQTFPVWPVAESDKQE